MSMRMRSFVLFVLFVLISAFSFSKAKAQQKTIYITLDVSGSMNGAKYDLANYSVQVISVLNNKNKVNFIVLGNTIMLSETDKYKTIHLNRSSITRLGKPDTKLSYHAMEIGTIDVFNSLFDKNDPSQEIFIIGDGYWNDDKEIKKNFLQHASTGNLRTTFLEILHNSEETTDFELFLKDNGIGKIYKVDSNNSIITAINTIAEEITGVSSFPATEFIQTSNCISFNPEMEILSLLILYQDGTPLNKIPSITSIENNGYELSFTNLGNPSNEKFQTRDGGLMSSRVYEVNTKMSAGSNISICFSDKIDLKKLRIFPVVDVQFGNVGIGAVVGKTKQISANSTGVCRDNETAEINIEFSQGTTKLSSGSIKNTTVTVISDGKSYPAKFDNGVFKAEIPLVGETTNYQIESEMKGYFRLNSGVKSIVKTECEPVDYDVPLEKTKLPAIDLGSITLDEFCRDGKITVQIVDSITNKSLDPTLFDIEVKNNYRWLFKDVRIEFKEDNFIDLYLESRGCWYNCLMPKKLRLDFYSTPKENQLIDGKSYAGFETELYLNILKTQSLFVRCKWLLISMLLSVFFIWFFVKLIKKNRFAKNSKIVFKAPTAATMRTLNPEYFGTDFKLRKKGFGAWLNRWFNPFVPEQNTLNFDTIGLSLLYTASNSEKYVFFPKSAYNESTMNLNYDKHSKHQYVKHYENNDLEVTHQRSGMGEKTKNYLEYSYPKESWNDITAFQNLLRILVFVLGFFLLATSYLIIKSLI